MAWAASSPVSSFTRSRNVQTLQVTVYWPKDKSEQSVNLAFIPNVGDWFTFQGREGKVEARYVEAQVTESVTATIVTIEVVE